MYPAAADRRRVQVVADVFEERTRVSAAERAVRGHNAAVQTVCAAASVCERHCLSGCTHSLSTVVHLCDLSVYPACHTALCRKTGAYAQRHRNDLRWGSVSDRKRHFRYGKPSLRRVYRETRSDRPAGICQTAAPARRRGLSGRKGAVRLQHPERLARKAAPVSVQQSGQ